MVTPIQPPIAVAIPSMRADLGAAGVEAAQQEGRGPERHAVGHERHGAEAEDGGDEGAVAEDAVEGLPLAHADALRPREGGVEADRERVPLRRVADRRRTAPGAERERGGADEVPGDAARSRARLPQREQRQAAAPPRRTRAAARAFRPDARRAAVLTALGRLAQRPHPERHQQPGQADREERDLPGRQLEGRQSRCRGRAGSRCR